MSQRGWLTPDSLPSANRTVTIEVPDDPEFLAMLLGAIMPLFYSENYEQYGTLTPEEVAEWWVKWDSEQVWT